ncbi:MAG TPA: endonuclease/exonuclease/phosphatase family protein [Vicinamibacteria bacterium]
MPRARRSLLLAAGALLLAPRPALAQTVHICAIQGSSFIPPMLGARVSASGVVTADFPARPGGFFMQEPGCDGDATTSDGIFVSTASRPSAVTVGHRVTVTGRVTDDRGLTALELESLSDNGPYAGSLEAVRLSPPSDPAAAAIYLEAYEGMLVSLPPSRVIAATDHLGDAYVMPDSSGVTRLYRGDADGRKLGLAAPASWLMLSQGDVVTDVAGVLAEVFGQYKLYVPPTRSLTVERSGLRPPESAALSSSTLSVATYDLQGLFDAVDDPGKDDEVPTPDQYAAGLARRAASIARYLGLPDVIGVQEAEKIEVLQDLAAQPALLPAGYRAVLVEGSDPQGLDVGLLYNSQRLWLRSSEARPGATFTRPPLVARLEALDNHERLTVIVNHFRSPTGDPAADEQVRVAQADAVRALADELKAAEPDVPLIVLGNLNAFEDSAPLQRLAAGGRLVQPMTLAAGERTYTYASQGLCEIVDHILVDAVLAPRVVQLRPQHVNVDFGDAGPGGSPEASPRASDHDPVHLLLARR